MFLAVDPGENVGIATFKSTGEDISKKVFRLPKFIEFLTQVHGMQVMPGAEKLTIVVEDFSLRKDKSLAQVGSRMPASQVIGALRFLESLRADNVELVLVDPRALYTALKWAGYANLANSRTHPRDDIAAYAHGVKYLIDIGLRKHPLDEE